MSVHDHLHQLRGGAAQWNRWREEHPEMVPDLSRYDFAKPLARGHQTGMDQGGIHDDLNMIDKGLIGANLRHVNLSGAKLRGLSLYNSDLRNANLSSTDLSQADLRDSNLDDADLSGANLTEVDFCNTTLRHVNLTNAVLVRTDFYYADLTGADLRGADGTTTMFVGSNLSRANMEGCRVHGASVWKVQLSGTVQRNLIITPPEEETITVDNLEVAQFIYLLLNNREIRGAIDTITSKVVLILGRFTTERKTVLDAIRDELRKLDFLPVLFDFEKPSNRDITETVSTLAHMARFVIADLTDPKSIPHELAQVIPLLPSVPFMPVIMKPQSEYSMFEHFFGFKHVLKPFRYRDERHLLASLSTKVIAPAEALAKRVAGKRIRR